MTLFLLFSINNVLNQNRKLLQEMLAGSNSDVTETGLSNLKIALALLQNL